MVTGTDDRPIKLLGQLGIKPKRQPCLVLYIYRPTVYTRILADSHISRPLKISVKMMIFNTYNNVIIVMRV